MDQKLIYKMHGIRRQILKVQWPSAVHVGTRDVDDDNKV
jgi:hypothetical protein